MTLCSPRIWQDLGRFILQRSAESTQRGEEELSAIYAHIHYDLRWLRVAAPSGKCTSDSCEQIQPAVLLAGMLNPVPVVFVKLEDLTVSELVFESRTFQGAFRTQV